MSGSLSRTDEMFILLNRLAANPDEESQQLLPDLSQRRSSFSQPAKPEQSMLGSLGAQPANESFLQVSHPITPAYSRPCQPIPFLCCDLYSVVTLIQGGGGGGSGAFEGGIGLGCRWLGRWWFGCV
jgi:hypothetical protein